MAPSSQRRARTRKHEEVVERSEVEDTETLATTATPTRKRRRVQGQSNDTPDRAEVAIAHQTSSATRRRRQPGPDVVEQELDEEQIADLVSQFRSAKTQARLDHANEKHEAERPDGMTAYAKIAGKGWTYYVTEVAIRIGRPPDERNTESHMGSGYPPEDFNDDHALVHVDLGPSKLVSRHHAEIRYDEAWTISVNGRNGIKLDEMPMQRGAKRQLTNGSVIEIAGTQMLFVMPNSSPTVHPAVWAAIRAHDEEDEDDVDGFKAPPRPAQRTPGRGLSSGAGHLPSSSNNYHGRGGSTHYGRNHAGSGTGQHDGSADGLTSGAAQSPAFPRGVMLDSTEDVDYSQDSAKDLKPPHSYAQLIGMAILWSDEEKLTLSKIYDYIKENYAFYRFQGGGWQNSIRHNLSLNKCFEKVARRTDEPGKGMKWKIVDEHRDEFMKRNINNPRKNGGARTSSAPNSPFKDRPSSTSAGFDRSFLDNKPLDNPFSRQSQSGMRGGGTEKPLPRSSSPTNVTYKTEQAATPEHGNAYLKGPMGVPSSPTAFLNGLSPFPDFARSRPYANGLNEAGAARTPAALAFQSGYDMPDAMATPLLGKRMPKFAPPSTARLPSQFMPLSSPAPFWRYAAEFPSSPAKMQQSSPMKLNGHAETHNDIVSEHKLGSIEDGIATAGSSSPPDADTEIGSGSPTGALSARGRSASQQQASQSQPEMTELSPAHKSAMPHRPSPNHKATEAKMHHQAPAPPVKNSVVAPGLVASDDDSEEEGHNMIDLARGFQPIGSFHRGMSAGVIRG